MADDSSAIDHVSGVEWSCFLPQGWFAEMAEEGIGATGHIPEALDRLAFWRLNDEGRKAFHSVAFGESFIGGALLGATTTAWEIDFEKNEVFLCVAFEFRRAEHLAVELDAPAAPVGAGEVDEEAFSFRLGLFNGLGVTRVPALSRSERSAYG